MTAAVPLLPVLAAEENCVGAMQEDSAAEEPSDDDVMEYRRSPRGRASTAAGAEPSAAPQQPADT